MLAYREEALREKLENQKAKVLEDIWRSAGLSKQPPAFKENENRSEILKWREQGIWNEALSPKEILKITTLPDPSNKKYYTPPKLNIPR